ncbi:hypothetical protein [Caldisericum sp.]|uniref:hypothetical protein n=1 Tax=Caldisericum sp. TaxID=2499687 RepID=UPI003D142EF9
MGEVKFLEEQNTSIEGVKASLRTFPKGGDFLLIEGVKVPLRTTPKGGDFSVAFAPSK